jgi:hypothetical protein
MTRELSVGPTRYRGCVKTRKFEKSGDEKSFDAIEKCFTGQLWTKIFHRKFFVRVFTQPLPRGGADLFIARGDVDIEGPPCIDVGSLLNFHPQHPREQLAESCV